MALGGGTFISENAHDLPGAYVNFVSTAAAAAELLERGTAAMVSNIDWISDGVVKIEQEQFMTNCLNILGYAYDDDKLKNFREIFANIDTLYFMSENTGEKASNDYATATHAGTRGNALKIAIQKNIDNESMFDVTTFIDTIKVDEQTVESAADLKDNEFVVFKKEAELAVTAGTALSGGTSTNDIAAHTKFLAAIESYSDINAVACASDTLTIKNQYISFAKRMRDRVGNKLQVVVHDVKADSEAVVSVKNTAKNETNAAALVYWVTGVVAGTAVNASATNMSYNGEYAVNTDYTQSELKDLLVDGQFVLHRVGDSVRVLEDINTFTSVSDTKGDVFKDNQTIRVIDQIATDIAYLFVNRYLGTVPNDKDGRAALWGDIVKHHKELEKIRAIEDFDADSVTVSQGDSKKSVIVSDTINVVNTMTRLYMTVKVS